MIVPSFERDYFMRLETPNREPTLDGGVEMIHVACICSNSRRSLSFSIFIFVHQRPRFSKGNILTYCVVLHGTMFRHAVT